MSIIFMIVSIDLQTDYELHSLVEKNKLWLSMQLQKVAKLAGDSQKL